MMSADDAVGCVRRSSPEAWTGEKKRKGADGSPCPPQGLIPSSSDDATDETMMQIPSQVQKEGSVFSAEDVITNDEYFRLCSEHRSRTDHIIVAGGGPLLKDEEICDMRERMAARRIEEYEILKSSGDIPYDAAPKNSYWPFEDASEPGPSVFGWTMDRDHCDLSGLNDYQRIVPMRAFYDEYLDWEEYRTTFSKYETDFQYVQYCEELSKKMKWIEAYFTDGKYEEFRTTYWGRGLRQAMKILGAFSSLPMTLAYRAYKEYLVNIEEEHRFNDYVHAAFELWKRIIKQQMRLEDALKQTLSENTFYYPRLIECQIKNKGGWMYIIYWNCMRQIPVVEDDKALKLITDLVNEKVNRTKVFVDYVKKKLEVARRIGLAGEFHMNFA